MALLWAEAMAWNDHGDGMDASKARAVPVKSAGFASYVGHPDWRDSEPEGQDLDGFDEDLWDATHPEPTAKEQAHYDRHDEFPATHHRRHEQAYLKAIEERQASSEPDEEDLKLHEFVMENGSNQSLWQNKGHLGKVDIRQPVHATQSHVGQTHIDRYLDDPKSTSWHEQQHGQPSDHSDRYLGHDHPMFVTHNGKLHVTEGHHRVAAALQRGDTHIHGWHYDGDKHGLPGWGEDD